MKNANNYNPVITRTILDYYLDRAREFRYLIYNYKKCTDLCKRREMRKRKEELILILDKAVMLNKYKLMVTLNMTYTELKDYPQLLEIKRKQEYLKRSIA